MKISLRGWLSFARVRTACLPVLLFAITGCSSFERQYEAALASSPTVDSPEGAWVGNWKSNRNGHTGELRCVIEKSVDDIYIATFKARYWKCFTYTSTADLTMLKNVDEFTFSGDAELGWLAGGTYQYEGRVTDRFFFSEYECRWDHGTFYMERPKEGQP